MGAPRPTAATIEPAVLMFYSLFSGLTCLVTLLLWIGRSRRAQAAAGLPRAGASELQRPHIAEPLPPLVSKENQFVEPLVALFYS